MDTNIVAAIVGAVVTGILGFIAYQYQQRKGNRVIVKQISQSPQITFEDSVKQKLEIIYNGSPVKNLVLTQFVIYNQGSKIIKPMKINLNFKSQSEPKTDEELLMVKLLNSMYKFAEFNVSDPQGITVSTFDGEKSTLEIERPYLNPKIKYKEEEIKVSVFSDILLDFSVSGAGEDWGSKIIIQESGGQITAVKVFILLAFVMASIAMVIGFLIDRLPNKGNYPLNGTVFTIVAMAIMTVTFYNVIPRVMEKIKWMSIIFPHYFRDTFDGS